MKYNSFFIPKASSQKNQIVELNDEDFGNFLETNREKVYKDIKIVVNKEFIIESNLISLSLANNFFKNLLSGKYQVSSEISISLPCGNIVLFEILLNFLLEGLLVVPEEMESGSWI